MNYSHFFYNSYSLGYTIFVLEENYCGFYMAVLPPKFLPVLPAYRFKLQASYYWTQQIIKNDAKSFVLKFKFKSVAKIIVPFELDLTPHIVRRILSRIVRGQYQFELPFKFWLAFEGQKLNSHFD